MPAGPLAYESRHPPHPLSEDEEAALAFAAAGMTGNALADLCYARGEGGNIMNGFVGRTASSGDGIQAVSLFVVNDEGAWLIKRARDFPAVEIEELIKLARAHAFTEFYRRSRVQVVTGRVAPPSEPLFNINCNRWSVPAPGTTYFLPVNDLTFLYINGLLEIFNETTGAYVLDERSGFAPAGLSRFARSRGGHLYDDPAMGRVATIEMVERLVTEFVTVEQGMILQNLALMAQALGLGGFPNFANHEFGWFQALGFRMGQMRASKYLGVGRLSSVAMRLLQRDPMIPFPIGLEVSGHPWLKAYSPPYFPSMAEAVRAVVQAKGLAIEQAGKSSAWDPDRAVAKGIPPIDETAVAATIAYCDVSLEPLRAVSGLSCTLPNRPGFSGFSPGCRVLRQVLSARGAGDLTARRLRPGDRGPVARAGGGWLPHCGRLHKAGRLSRKERRVTRMKTRTSIAAFCLAAAMVSQSAPAQSTKDQTTTQTPSAATDTSQGQSMGAMGLIRFSKIKDADVQSQMGRNVAELKDLAIDAETGQIGFAVVGVGGFLGLGQRLVAIPWQEVTTASEKELSVNVDQAKLKNAPRLAKDYSNLSDADFMARIDQYYSIQPSAVGGAESPTGTQTGGEQQHNSQDQNHEPQK